MKKILLASAFAAAALSVGALDASASTPQVHLFCKVNYLSVERGTLMIMVRNDSGDITIPKGSTITINIQNSRLGKKNRWTMIKQVSYKPINPHGDIETFNQPNPYVRRCTATADRPRVLRHS
jgi:hypothetical protein